MLKNYVKIALRNIVKHKLFSFINVIGLSIGISAALVIYLIVQHDLSFDKFHPNGERIYRVVSNFTFQGQEGYNRGISGPVPGAIAAEVPGIEKSAPFRNLYGFDAVVQRGKGTAKFKQQTNTITTDSRYFDLFKYKWLAGSEKNALNEPNKIVLTLKQATLYFPGLTPQQMLGRTVTYDDTLKTSVAGVVENFKENSDLNFHDFISYKTIYAHKNVNHDLQLENWDGTSSSSQYFVQLNKQANPIEVEKEIDRVVLKHDPPNERNRDYKRRFHLQALSDLHFNTNYGAGDDTETVSKTTLYGLLTIGLFLLLLGCINFINLVTAQSTQRAKEMGIRKTIGGTRQQLIIQLLSETFVITLIAVIISLVCTPFILKLFADFISPDVKLDIFNHPGICAFLLILTLVMSVLSGLYPALLLSGYKPIQVLKNQSVFGKGTSRTALMRKSLTVMQFVIAQFFIMATILVSKQIYYAVHKDLGFKKDAIIYVNTPWKGNDNTKIQYFKDKVSAMPQVAMVSQGNDSPSSSNMNGTEATYKDGKKEIKIQLDEKFGDANYIKLYHIKLVAGRNLRQSDTSKALLVNIAYTRVIGLKNPADAVGKTLDKFNGDHSMQIVGVISNFQQSSVHEELRPLCIQWFPKKYNNNVLHIALHPETTGGHEWKDAITAMGRQWKQVYPEADFEYHFFDESIKNFYQAEQHTSQLLTWSSGLSVLISCLGLLGLAMYTTRTRTKEIGVRKVLGATVSQLVALLSREIVLLIVVAFVIVTPIAWWAMNGWIRNFADRTAISWWIFAISGGGMLITAMLTSMSQTVKAATANPVKSLRSE